MPYIRTARGTRAQFKPTYVARILSETFQALYGVRVARFRSDIQQQTEKVIELLENTLGNDPVSEWTEEQILQAIESILRHGSFEDVHAVFLERHPASKKTRAQRTRLAAFEPLTEQQETDPLWTVQSIDLDLNNLKIQGEHLQKAKIALLGNQIGRAKKKELKGRDVHHARRSEWMQWWRTQAKNLKTPMDIMALEEAARKTGPALRSQTPDEWWKFWQPLFDEAMKKDPRLIFLLQAAQIRRARGALTGHSWLYGTPMTQVGKILRKALLVEDADADALYQKLWIEHIQRFNDIRMQGYSLEPLSRLLRPERDYWLDWRGYQKLQSSEAIRPIREDQVWMSAADLKTSTGAHEPPQWAWLRLAMVLASQEKEPLVWATRWYESFSTLTVIPSESLLRQAGKRSPRLIEDMAARVSDNFEATQEAIYQAALNTKWTGTVSLDWGRVRAKGSPIAGRRVSQGVASFVRAIDTNLVTQGRPSFERPVTVSLPIWHREIEDFLTSTKDSQCIQTVISVSDLFMERVRNNGQWTLFDPAFFPTLEEQQEDGYLKAETQMGSVLKKQPQAIRVISATRLWNKVLRQIQKTGRPCLIFTGSQKSFEPFPGQHPVQHGIDGVGALPLPPPESTVQNHNLKNNPLIPAQTDETYRSAMPWVMWPAAAVNLKEMISHDGTPDVPRLRDACALAMRMLDNAFSLSEEEGRLASWASAHRSVCLGAVGFQEAIERAAAVARDDQEVVDAWVRSLAETWATAVITADQDLKKERGAAPAWREPAARVYNPVQSMARFQERRGGSLAVPFKTQTNWEEVSKRIQKTGGHRMSARTLWAPFQGAAAIAAVSPGGIGPLDPVEKVIDEEGKSRWVPTPALLMLIKQHPENLKDFSKVMANPEQFGRWPQSVRLRAKPDLATWRTLLRHAALIRPWVDQGVALTLPADMDMTTLQSLVEQAWQNGVDCVRFEPPADSNFENNKEENEKLDKD